MLDIFYLAWRYLVFNRIKTTILIVAIALITFLPIGLNILVNQSADSLTTRAKSTPLIIGAKGSPLELTLNTLYYQSKMPPEIAHSEVERVKSTGLASAIPIYNRFSSSGFPVVGTSIDYFDFRALTIAEGRNIALLGECILGAAVAETLGLRSGDSIITTPESAFDLAGVYPLKMHIVGVLAPKGTPDDQAIFTDLKTSWIISGLAHGHQNLSNANAKNTVSEIENNHIVANASLIQFNEITDQNRASFHFHGEPSTFPITAVIALPNDDKSSAILQGKYLSSSETMQIIHPTKVIDELLVTILTIQDYVLVGAVLTGAATIMTVILVFMLSIRLRQGEIQTMRKIGVSGSRIFLLLSTEIIAVLAVGFFVAIILSVLLAEHGKFLIDRLLF